MKKIILISLIFISLIYSNKLFSNPADTVNIYHYEIFLDLHDITVPSIKGNCIISLNPQIDNLKSIKLDLLSLNVDSLKINNLRSDSYSYNRKNIDINFDKGFNRTDSVSINIYYHGSPVIDISNFGGFYFTDNYAFNLGVGLKANPPGFGRAWFPCIDDFRIKSTYDFHIKTSTKNKAICNGLLVSIDNNYVDNTNTYHWKINRLITSYLASVAVGNYTSINDTLNGKINKIPVNIFVKPSDSANAVKSFVNLKSALNIFENLFGPYKWERIGYVGVPFTDGAMEHASNIAIPESLINGTINNEHVFYHELSHHWFGDLVTCAMPEDMWLNEGWATYCESLFSEYLYGNKAFKDYQRGIHHISIQLSGIIDSSVFPVFNPPQNYTYGVTTYYKGNDVVHSLRNYIGDSLFFSTIRSYMKDYSYKNISTDQFRKYFENKTNINLKDFFDNWLYTAGFPHFSTDSFTVNPNGKKYDITVFFRQRLSRRNFFSNSNKIEVSFMDKSWNTYKDTATISGEYSSKKFTLPFNPEIVMLDPDEKVSDATTDNYKIINSTGKVQFNDTYSYLDVNSVSDSAFIRIELNWVSPDNQGIFPNGILLSSRRYWNIYSIIPSGFNSKIAFQYAKGNDRISDFNLSDYSLDSLVLLYRKKTGDLWMPVKSTHIGNKVQGFIISDNFAPGQYAIGVYDYINAGIKNIPSKKIINPVTIYPNPSNDYFNIILNNPSEFKLSIYDSLGNEITTMKTSLSQKTITWKPESNLSNGTYILKVFNSSQLITTEKIILTR